MKKLLTGLFFACFLITVCFGMGIYGITFLANCSNVIEVNAFCLYFVETIGWLILGFIGLLGIFAYYK